LCEVVESLKVWAMKSPIGAATALILAACGSPAAHPKEPAMATSTQISPQRQVIDLLKSIETGDGAPVAVINPEKYTQHNLAVADGLAGFGALLAQLPKGSARVSTVRAFRDGDFVFTHTDYNFFGPKIGFDIFRFEDGKIVEHWDNLQEKPSRPNPSGHTMTDGPTEPTEREKTEENKATVRSFVDDILVNGRLDKLSGYYDGDHYVQHNPQIADGVSGLGAALKAMADAGVVMKYERVHRVLGEGNFVLVVSEGSLAGAHTAFYDLFRVQGGKIAEHWDTIETIPAKEQWKNQNGKF
jgi:predicted SnoaL-like aldol condensation-catalyzing enzyme